MNKQQNNLQQIERITKGLTGLNYLLDKRNDLNKRAADLYLWEYNEGLISAEEYLNKLNIVEKHALEIQDDTEYLKHMFRKLTKKVQEAKGEL